MGANTAGLKYITAHPEAAPDLGAAKTRMKAAMSKRSVRCADEPAIRSSDLQPIINAAHHGLILKAFSAREIKVTIAAVRQ